MFTRMQVARTSRKHEVKSEGLVIPAGTRVVVIHEDKKREGSFLVKIVDPDQPELNDHKVTIGQSKLKIAYRGRPKGSTAEVVAARRHTRRLTDTAIVPPDLRAELKAELKAEIEAELKGELVAA